MNNGRRTPLPREVLEACLKHGLGGKRIRVPTAMPDWILEDKVAVILGDVEDIYDAQGLTFIKESQPKRRYQERFGIRELVKTRNWTWREAARASQKAYEKWEYWYVNKEEARLSRILDFCAERRANYARVVDAYKKMRESLRKKKPVGTADLAARANVSSEDGRYLLRLADASVKSRPWAEESQGRDEGRG